ncbi:MAG: LptF/LptG family permease, partial [Candidatus Gastranaerophilales bacterium]|nr:LptF/LptG family permease [Candidatus Gastranaerophilales bacterium]
MIKPKNVKIFDMYIFNLVAIATLIGIVAFIVVWISPETLFKVINRVSSHQITLKQGLEWLFFEIPTVLGKAIPVGLLLGTLAITDMLSRNFELVIFRSIGISFWRIARPILVLSGLLAIFCYFGYTTFIPYSSNRVEMIKAGKDTQALQWSYLEKDSEGNPKQLIIIP